MNATAQIVVKFSEFLGVVVSINKKGEHTSACRGWTFKYVVRSPAMNGVEVITTLT